MLIFLFYTGAAFSQANLFLADAGPDSGTIVDKNKHFPALLSDFSHAQTVSFGK
jgi:hypothetical protein